MDIESLRHFFQHDLPRYLISFFSSLSAIFAHVPYQVYITAIFLLIAAFVVLGRRIRHSVRMDEIRARITGRLASVRTVQELISLLYDFFREIDPSIRKIGIYTRSQDAYRLLNAESLEDGATESALDTIIAGKAGHDRMGRFHYFTYVPDSGRFAVRLISVNKVESEDIKAELQYLTAYLENFIETDSLRTELFKSRLISATREVFSSTSHNRAEYFTFLGNILRKANNLDGVVVVTKDGEIVLGNGSLPDSACRVLRVRNTDLQVRICRSSGITHEDIASVGKFLDVISASLALYADKYLVYNYLYFLETAVSVHESGDRFYHRHSEKVNTVCLRVATHLGLDEEKKINLQYAAKLHDIGMMGELLDLAGKETRFSDREYGLLRYHPLTGAALVTPVDSTHPIATIILQHHEALDGTGYPNGISGGEMLLESKILALAEIFVGLISDRAHRKGLSFDDAVTHLSRMVPRKVDPEVFRAFAESRSLILKDLQRVIEPSP